MRAPMMRNKKCFFWMESVSTSIQLRMCSTIMTKRSTPSLFWDPKNLQNLSSTDSKETKKI